VDERSINRACTTAGTEAVYALSVIVSPVRGVEYFAEAVDCFRGGLPPEGGSYMLDSGGATCSFRL